MKQLSKIVVLLCLLPMALFATENPKFKGKYTKTKTLNKEYTVNANAALKVTNSYGNLDIVTWNENRTVIEVVITTNGNDESKVQAKLDKIDVDFSGSASQVTAKTLFGGKKNSSWSWWGKNNNVHMEVNYTIKLPIGNSVDLNNDYGAINMNELNGNARISCDYGQVNLGSLNADDNSLNFDYSKNSTIAYMKSGKINADYSSFVLEDVGSLDLNADYTKSEVQQAMSINYNNDYGKMIVGTVKDLIGRGDYIPLRLNTLTGNLNVNTDYGSVSVENATSTAGDITIDSSYAGISIEFASGYNFDFNVDLTYASLRGEDGLEIEKQSKSNSRKSYSGYHGSKGSGNTVNINSDYGGVTLERN